MSKAPNIRPIKVPPGCRGLGRIFKGERFVGWVTFWGWQPRYLLADDWEFADAVGGWLASREFGDLMTAPLRDYRIEWVEQ